MSMIPSHNAMVFGIKNSLELSAVNGFVVGVTCMLGPIFAKFILKETFDYLIIFLTGTSFAMMSLVVLFFYEEKKFVYTQKEDNESKL